MYRGITNLLCDIGTGARLLLSNRLPRSSLTYVGEGRPPAAVNAAGLPIPMIELDISPWLSHAVLCPRLRRLCMKFGDVNSGSLAVGQVHQGTPEWQWRRRG